MAILWSIFGGSFLFFTSLAFGDSLYFVPVPSLDLPDYPSLVTPTRNPEASIRIPARTIVITKEEIFEMGAQDLGDVFSSLPGTHVIRFGYLGEPKTLFLRGSSSEQVLYLLDGIRVNDIEKGGLDLALIPLNWIERIEILLEGASSLYGSDAVGGVVNIITKGSRGGFESPRKRGRPSSRVGLGRGSFETTRTEFEIGRDLGKKMRLYLTGDLLKSVGFQDYAYKLWSGSGGWEMDSLLGWRAALSGRHFQGGHGFFSTDSLEKSHSHFSLSLNKRASELLLSLREEVNREESVEDRYRTLRAHSVTRLYFLLAGLEGGVKWGREKEIMEGGVFIEGEREIFPLFKMIPMMRGDANSVYGLEISPKLSFGYTPTLFLHLFTSADLSYRSPTFEELYGLGGDSTLTPVKIFSLNGGFEVQHESWKIGFSLFREETKGKLGSNPKALHVGMEGEIEKHFNALDSQFRLRGFGTALSSKDQETGGDLPYRPEFEGGWSIQWMEQFIHGNLGLRLLLEGEVVGERVSDFGDPLDDYNLFHSRGEFQIVDFKMFVRGSNLLDRDYFSRLNSPLPGRTFHMGISWVFWD